MPISLDEVRKIAALARIELTPAEETRHAATISAVLDYMKILNEVDTKNVSPTYQVTGLTNVFRSDTPEASAIVNKLVDLMPVTGSGELVVPAVFKIG
ncbi:MAG: Asp-tRNA(Asn)/Glu-tRNA(Gln) amidotransferase subunit GatC [Candidatus Magasanikbacteria bacterium]|nr:Asp-tRNA(Asn)/Glu-tRNA(Gln) amidotransferase subunit GatC [Candidatus Magasanikbacteria bacterium]